MLFASLVAEFGLLLRNSKYKGTSSYTHIKDVYNEYDDFKKDIESIKDNQDSTDYIMKDLVLILKNILLMKRMHILL